MKILKHVLEEIQRKYYYLTNYEGDDPTAPIDPLTYVDSNGDTLLHIAAQQGDAETIAFLLDSGVDVNSLGDMGATALHYAHENQHKAIAELLIRRGASTDIKNGFGKLPGE